MGLEKYLPVFESLPATAQPYILAILIILIGYLFSKIMAASVDSGLQAITKKTPERFVEHFLSRIPKSLFWITWSIFFVLGLLQLPAYANFLASLKPVTAMDFIDPAIAGYVLLILILTYTEARFKPLFKPLQDRFQNTRLDLFHYVFWTIMAIAVLAPPSIFQTVAAAIVAFVLGFILARVLKEAVLATFQNRRLAKLIFYAALVPVLIVTASILFSPK